MKLIPNHPSYAATISGEIISYKRKHPKKLKSNIKNNGYLSVCLDNIHYSVHKVIAMTFLGEKGDRHRIVRHLDGNKLNNHVKNLAFGSAKDNSLDYIKHSNITCKRIINPNGPNAPKCKKLIAKAKKLLDKNLSYSKVVKATGLSKTTVGRIKKQNDYRKIISYKDVKSYINKNYKGTKLKSISEFPDRYILSTGIVISTCKNTIKELHGHLDASGYKNLSIYSNGKTHTKKIHLLVIEAFKGKRPSLMHVARHMDGIKINNNINNLEWGTYKENARDAVNHKKIKAIKEN